MPSGGGLENAERGANQQDAEEDQARNTAALAKPGVSDGRGAEREKEAHYESHAAGILKEEAV